MDSRRLFLLAILSALASRAAIAEPLPSVNPTPSVSNLAPEEGLLILRNGQTLKGRVARSGDRWFVWLPDGEIRLAAADVELFCRDLHEGYLRKREGIAPSRLLDRLQLAEWCLSHSLIEEAKQETQAASQLDPQHPNVKYLQRRLEVLASAPAPPPAIEMPDAGPSNESLDRFARKLTPETTALFTQTIQPLLVNRCGMGACHGPQATNRWELQRIPLHGAPRQRLTQRNLFATFPFVASKDVTSQPLYIYATTAHGGAKQPTFGARDTASLQQLAIWLQYAARDADKVQDLTPYQASNMTANLTASASPSGSTDASAPSASLTTVSAAPATVTPLATVATDAAASRTPSAVPASPSSGAPFTPSDPFDPEIFNRQFGAQPN